jgi:hypothetical protein
MLKRKLVLLAVVLGLILCAFLLFGDNRHLARFPMAEFHQPSLDIVL